MSVGLDLPEPVVLQDPDVGELLENPKVIPLEPVRRGHDHDVVVPHQDLPPVHQVSVLAEPAQNLLSPVGESLREAQVPEVTREAELVVVREHLDHESVPRKDLQQPDAYRLTRDARLPRDQRDVPRSELLDGVQNVGDLSLQVDLPIYTLVVNQLILMIDQHFRCSCS